MVEKGGLSDTSSLNSLALPPVTPPAKVLGSGRRRQMRTDCLRFPLPGSVKASVDHPTYSSDAPRIAAQVSSGTAFQGNIRQCYTHASCVRRPRRRYNVTTVSASDLSLLVEHQHFIIKPYKHQGQGYLKAWRFRGSTRMLNAARLDMSSAAHQVLFTIELLEQVLLQLPFQSLIAAHQVCHIWNATIRHSTTLQRALFLAPVPCWQGRHHNGALKDVSPSNGALKKSLQTVKPQLNKVLAKKFRLGILNDPEEDYDGGYMPMVSYGGDAILRGERAHDPKEASWRKMHITQPPARRVEIAVFHVEDGLTEKDCVSDEEGVRMGQMVEWVQQRPWRRDLKRRSMGWYFEL